MAGSSHGRFESIEAEEVYPGVRRRAFSSEQATVTRYDFGARARFPIHRHPSEQVTLVEQGAVEFTVDGRTTPLTEGDWSVVAADVEHGLVAGPDGARIVAIVVPRRDGPNDYEVVQR